MQELYQGQAGEADIKWQAQYGGVVRLKGPFGVRNLTPSLDILADSPIHRKTS